MFVVSKVLWGRLEVRSFDLVDRQAGDAVVRGVDFTSAGQTRVLTPQWGNVHSFHTAEWTAVFDVLVPPYDALQGRECHYYRLVKQWEGETIKQGQHILLEETTCPDWYRTVPVQYNGVAL